MKKTKKTNDTIRNGTSNLPACSAVPKPTASPPTPKETRSKKKGGTEFERWNERKRK